MTRQQIDKRQLTNAMKKLGKKIIAIEGAENFEDKAYDLIQDIFPNACEIHSEYIDEIHFICEVDYIGKAPTKKEMLAEDEFFHKIEDMYGLDMYFENMEDAVKVVSTIAVDYCDKWGNSYNTGVVVKEVIVEKPIKTVNNIIEDPIRTNKDLISQAVEKEGLKLESCTDDLNKLSKKELQRVLNSIGYGSSTTAHVIVNKKDYVVEISEVDGEVDIWMITRAEYEAVYGEIYEEDWRN